MPNHSFAELLDYLHIVYTYTISTIKIFVFMKHTLTFQRIIYTLEIATAERYHSKTIREKCRKQCIILTMLFIIFSSATVMGYVAKGILDGLARGGAEEGGGGGGDPCSLSSLPVPVRVPFCASSGPLYALVFTYTMVSFSWCGYSSLFIDLTVACIMLQLRAQLRVLCLCLEHLDVLAADQCRRATAGPCTYSCTNDIDEIQADTALCSLVKRRSSRRGFAEKNTFFKKKCFKDIIEQHIVLIE